MRESEPDQDKCCAAVEDVCDDEAAAVEEESSSVNAFELLASLEDRGSDPTTCPMSNRIGVLEFITSELAHTANKIELIAGQMLVVLNRDVDTEKRIAKLEKDAALKGIISGVVTGIVTALLGWYANGK